MTAIAASRQPVFRTPLDEGRACPADLTQDGTRRLILIPQSRIGSAAVQGEAVSILLVQLKADSFAQCQCAVQA